MSRRPLVPLALAATLLLAPPPAAARPALAVPADAVAADTLVLRSTGEARRRALERWAKGASLTDLVWLLRRPAHELGDAEPLLARVALDRCPPERAALRARLAARLDPREAGKRKGPPAPVPVRVAASAFRVGVMLPDSGDYADFAREVWVGLEAGIASTTPAGSHAPELEFWPTGDQDPAHAAAALEAGSTRCGVLLGELLSATTRALATGARLLGLPLVSPTATDEAIGTIGPAVFQVGPSGWSRGARLARVMLGRPGMRVGLLTAGDPERDAFALGFAAIAESLGCEVAWRAGYREGIAFREEVKAVGARKLDVLLWDGEAREVEALLRELARQKVSVRLCGGEALAPERVHIDVRVLLEGVRYVADEWALSGAQHAVLDSAVRARGADRVTAQHARGWLAGRALGAVLAGGALCPEEVAAALTARCGPPPWLSSHRFLDVEAEGARLPMMAVVRGRAIPEAP